MNTITVLLLLLGLHIAVTERIRPAIRSLAAQGILLDFSRFSPRRAPRGAPPGWDLRPSPSRASRSP